MRLLLTRSEELNDVFQREIQARFPEADVCQLTMLDQRATDSREIVLDQILREYPVNEVIFISPAAVDFGAEAVHKKLGLQRYFTVGKGSAERLKRVFELSTSQQTHPDIIFPVEGSGSEALLALEFFKGSFDSDSSASAILQGKKFLIVTGSDGKALLEQALIAQGAQVCLWECYQRYKPSHLSDSILRLLNDGIDMVMLHSSHAARNLIQALPSNTQELSRNITAIVGAPAIAEELSSLNWSGAIVVAQSPSPDDMLSSLSELFAKS